MSQITHPWSRLRLAIIGVLAVVLLLLGVTHAFAAVGDFAGILGSYGSGDGEFKSPFDAAIASNGDVYVADTQNHRIQYFSSTGAYKGQWGTQGMGNGQFRYPVNVAIAPNGDVYVADSDNSRIQYFSATGVYKGQWGSSGTGSGEFDFPYGIDVAPSGVVYVVDHRNHRVQYFSPTGAYKGQWGTQGTGSGELEYPIGIGIAPNGDVYVTDHENHRIQYFSPTGTYKGQWGSEGTENGEFAYPSGITFAHDGDVYVVDTENARIQYFSPAGAYKGQWGEPGSVDGAFDLPWGIAVAPNGDLYIADLNNNRIQHFSGPPATTARLADRTRFSTAVAIAKAGFPEWAGVKHVVIASGDDRAAADPLAASGLCWAYDAPMLLVSAARTPDEVKAALSQIVAKNGSVTLHIVGGPVSVPDARVAELVAAGGGGAKVATDRLLATGGRYDLARAIALRMKSVAATNPAKTMPKTALFANGADATKFFDALALSPISAGTGAPILLVTATSVPPATTSAIAALAPSTKIVGGGPNTVSEAVRAQLGATRWSGRTRYDTAIAIADGAVSKGWLNRGSVGIAAKLPDALTGGSLVGAKRGVLLLSDGTTLTPVTGSWLKSYKSQIGRVWVFGGPLSISEGVKTAIGNAIK